MTVPSYVAHGVTLAFAWLLLVNVLVSGLVAFAVTRCAHAQPTSAARFWFALRLSPAVVSAIFVAALFLPSYWKYEPRDAVEGFDVTLAALALVAVLMLACAAARGACAWWQASRRVRAWMRGARSLAPDGSRASPIPSFEIDGPMPMMALSGIVRPRLFVARALVSTLTEDELEATVAHEIGHWRAWDNLKRLAMRSAPDVLFLMPAARRIERRWASAAEHSADRIGGANTAARCALASALVKVARLIGDEAATQEPISTLVGGGEIASRVERLLDDRAAAREGRRRPIGRFAVAAGVASGLLIAYGPLLRAVHDATEFLVRSLP
jgi:Zn-dependent protease with chaperone function